jgi:hypothetical protein
MSLIHEMAHALHGLQARRRITDRAYIYDRMYALLTTAEALTNAESYALFAWQLGSGRPIRSEAPRYEQEDCPADWRPLIRVAAARAERWNRNAQTVLSNRTPAAVRARSAMFTRRLGASPTEALDRAQRAYDRLEERFHESITIECEWRGGGRCERYVTYWFEFWSDFHICPSWRRLATEDDRTEAMLRGLYGYVSGADDTTAGRFAGLARELNAAWAAPTLEEVIGP